MTDGVCISFSFSFSFDSLRFSTRLYVQYLWTKILLWFDSTRCIYLSMIVRMYVALYVSMYLYICMYLHTLDIILIVFFVKVMIIINMGVEPFNDLECLCRLYSYMPVNETHINTISQTGKPFRSDITIFTKKGRKRLISPSLATMFTLGNRVAQTLRLNLR